MKSQSQLRKEKLNSEAKHLLSMLIPVSTCSGVANQSKINARIDISKNETAALIYLKEIHSKNPAILQCAFEMIVNEDTIYRLRTCALLWYSLTGERINPNSAIANSIFKDNPILIEKINDLIQSYDSLDSVIREDFELYRFLSNSFKSNWNEEKYTSKSLKSSANEKLKIKRIESKLVSTLPEALWEYKILVYLNKQDIGRLAITLKDKNTSNYRLFKKNLEQRKLLHHIVMGEQKDAMKILLTERKRKETPYSLLLQQKYFVTDHADRSFYNTGLQLACWNLDRDMWTMLISFMSKAHIIEQLNDLVINNTNHGKHYKVEPLLDAMKHACENMHNAKKMTRIFIEEVGNAQRLMPAHFFHEYLHPDRPLSPTPNFKNSKELPRTVTASRDSTETVFPPSGTGLGTEYALFRGPKRYCVTLVKDVNDLAMHGTGTSCDEYTLMELSNVRLEQLNELIRLYLAPTPAMEARAHLFD